MTDEELRERAKRAETIRRVLPLWSDLRKCESVSATCVKLDQALRAMAREDRRNKRQELEIEVDARTAKSLLEISEMIVGQINSGHENAEALRPFAARVAELEAERDSLLRMISCEDYPDIDCTKPNPPDGLAHRCFHCQIFEAQDERDRLAGALEGARKNTERFMEIDPTGYAEDGFAIEDIDDALGAAGRGEGAG